MLLPGFVEHHCHFRAWAMQHTQLDVSDAMSIDALLNAVRRTPERVVRAHGLAASVVTQFTSAHQLTSLRDAASGRPVLLTSRDGHAVVATHELMHLAGLHADDLPVDGGVVERDAAGAWTGVLREAAAWRVRAAMPLDTTDDALRTAVSIAASRGVTTLHDMDGMEALRDWARLHDLDGDLDMRVTVHLLASELDDIDTARTFERPGRIKIGGLKAFADGTLGSGTALLHEPEIPRPGHAPRIGVAIATRDELIELARRGAAFDLPLCVHAIGDAAATTVVDALEATHDAWRDLSAPPRIEHAQLMRVEDIARCARLGIDLSVQPAMLITDEHEAEARWGTERTQRAYAYRTMHDHGARLLFGSDAPIEPLDPLAAIRAAVLRTWHPEQRVEIDTAISAATGWASRTVAADHDAVELTGATPEDWRVARTRLGSRWTYVRK